MLLEISQTFSRDIHLIRSSMRYLDIASFCRRSSFWIGFGCDILLYATSHSSIDLYSIFLRTTLSWFFYFFLSKIQFLYVTVSRASTPRDCLSYWLWPLDSMTYTPFTKLITGLHHLWCCAIGLHVSADIQLILRTDPKSGYGTLLLEVIMNLIWSCWWVPLIGNEDD